MISYRQSDIFKRIQDKNRYADAYWILADDRSKPKTYDKIKKILKTPNIYSLADDPRYKVFERGNNKVLLLDNYEWDSAKGKEVKVGDRHVGTAETITDDGNLICHDFKNKMNRTFDPLKNKIGFNPAEEDNHLYIEPNDVSQ